MMWRNALPFSLSISHIALSAWASKTYLYSGKQMFRDTLKYLTLDVPRVEMKFIRLEMKMTINPYLHQST